MQGIQRQRKERKLIVRVVFRIYLHFIFIAVLCPYLDNFKPDNLLVAVTVN
jgi:hypothetical protein